MIQKDGYHGEYVKDLALDVMANNEQIGAAFNAMRKETGLPPLDYVAMRDSEKAEREAKGGRPWRH